MLQDFRFLLDTGTGWDQREVRQAVSQLAWAPSTKTGLHLFPEDRPHLRWRALIRRVSVF